MELAPGRQTQNVPAGPGGPVKQAWADTVVPVTAGLQARDSVLLPQAALHKYHVPGPCSRHTGSHCSGFCWNQIGLQFQSQNSEKIKSGQELLAPVPHL